MIPEKYFYTIGEASRITGTKPHVLRYWESEFKLLRPARRYSGHRKYTQRDIDIISKIRFLVLEKKYTLAGAKREINRQFSPHGTSGQEVTSTNIAGALPLLKEIKKELESCLEILGKEEKQQELMQLTNI